MVVLASQVTIVEKADCSSVLDLLVLSAGFDSELELLAEGPDARAAMDEVSDFFARKFETEEPVR